MPSWDTIEQYWPGWLVILVVVVLTLNRLIEESAKVANVFGGVGRWWRQRALRRHQINLAADEFAQALTKAIQQAREEWEEEENEALAAMQRRVGSLAEISRAQNQTITELQFDMRCCTAYADYEALWHNRLRAHAARSPDGLVRLEDMPVHIPYFDFLVRFRENQRWREWIDQ